MQNCRVLDPAALQYLAEYPGADAFGGGVNEYLPTPFNPREFVARMKAILRRLDDRRTGPDGFTSPNITMTSPYDKPGRLHPAALHNVEFPLLEVLLRNAGMPEDPSPMLHCDQQAETSAISEPLLLMASTRCCRPGCRRAVVQHRGVGPRRQ